MCIMSKLKTGKYCGNMVVHGYTPDTMLLSVVIPIPKDNKSSRQDSSNYRNIYLMASLCKLFDHIILNSIKIVLNHQICNMDSNPITQLQFVHLL